MSSTEPNEAKAPNAEAVITVDGLTVRLGGRDILRGVDVTIHAGELVGLIGANGAGKTTLLRAILGLIPSSSSSARKADGAADAGSDSSAGSASSGRAASSDRAAGSARWGAATDSGAVHLGPSLLTARGKRAPGAIGYVPQKVSLDPDAPLRARDVVALGVDGNRLGIPLPNPRRTQRVDELLAAVDASVFASQRIGRLSGGQQQRVLIAHALASDPRVLLLDEPLANLDIANVHEVVELLARLARERGIAVVLTAHDMNPLLPVMNRVVYLAGGRAVSGTPEEVVQSEVLTELYGSRVDVLHVQGRVVVVAGQG